MRVSIRPIAATIAVAALTVSTLATAAHAQFSGNTTYDAANKAYFVTGDATLSGDVSGNEVFVGKNNATSFATQPGSNTLTIATGATTTYNNGVFGGATYYGVNVFGNHKVAINGGSVQYAYGYNTSTTNIGGGSVSYAQSFNTSTTNITGGSVDNAIGYNTGTVNISGGSVNQADGDDTSTTNISGSVNGANGRGTSTTNITGGTVNNTLAYDSSTFNITGGTISFARDYGTSTTNISGGTVNYTIGYSTSTLNISGGTLTNGFLLYDTTAKLNFVGTGLSFAYSGYGNSNPYIRYADFFKVSGTFGGAAKTYNLYIRNETAGGGATTPNSAARGFTFNGAAVAVPEAGTLALLLPALGVVCGIIVRKRRTASL